MCGDIAQTDLLKKHDPSGWWRFMTILEGMNNVLHVNFTTDDIVRSGLVKEYLIAKEKING
jgi:phosphate starvation-inducible protein PhoH